MYDFRYLRHCFQEGQFCVQVQGADFVNRLRSPRCKGLPSRMMLFLAIQPQKPEQKKNPDSLEDLCFEAIANNAGLYTPELIGDLNKPCLEILAHRLSLNDLFTFEDVMKNRGLNVPSVYKAYLDQCFDLEDFYPVTAVTLPHELSLAVDCGWDGKLSFLLSESVFTHVFHLHNMALMKDDPSPGDYLTAVAELPHIKQLFVSRHNQDMVSSDPTLRVHQYSKPLRHCLYQFLEKAARKLLSITADSQFFDFFKDSRNINILMAMCTSLGSISFNLTGDEKRIDVVKRVMDHASLKSVSLRCIQVMDMVSFDLVMSKCSGVTGFYNTVAGIKKNAEFQAKYFNEDRHSGKLKKQIAKSLLESRNESTSDRGRLLDSCSSVSSFRLEVSRSVPMDLYKNVLCHHFRYWLSLVKFEFTSHKVDKEMAAIISVLIRRKSFKSLSLSHCSISGAVLDDILSCVATCRKQAPLDELMLVDLMSPSGNCEAFDDFQYYERQHISHHLRALKSFQGCKLLEVSGNSLDARMQCALHDFISRDKALQQLYLVNSMLKPLVNSLFLNLAGNAQSLTHLNLEDCCLDEFDNLTAFLAAQAKTLVSLSLKGSFCLSNEQDAKEVAASIQQCMKLHTLSVEQTMLGSASLPFVQIVLTPSLKNLCLANNKMCVTDTVRILKYLSMCAGPKGPLLDILDVSCDEFTSRNREHYAYEAKRAAKMLLCEKKAILGLMRTD